MNEQDLNAFREIVGPLAVLTEAADRLRYESGARYGSGTCAAVVRPASIVELSAVVAYAVGHGISLLPQSGNTGLVRGSVPDESGRMLVVSLDRLREPLKINIESRSAEVGAGVRLSELNAIAEPHKLFLPIDLGADPMIGGMIATNTGGARFIRYGGIRSRVLALTVVLSDGDGTILRIGKGLRKDNSQLDLKQLFIGSSGALGIVASATLELAKVPHQSTVALLVPKTPADTLLLLRYAEEHLSDFLSAFEGMSREAIEAALRHVPGLRNPFPGGTIPEYAVLIELSAMLPADVVQLDEVLQNALLAICEWEDSPVSDALFGDHAQLWRLRHALSEGARAMGPVVGFDLSFSRERVFEFREAARHLIEKSFPECRICDFGHVGDGGVHFNVVTPQAWPTERLSALDDEVVSLALLRFGGSFSGEHGIGRSNQHHYDRFTPDELKLYAGRVTSVFATAANAAARFGSA